MNKTIGYGVNEQWVQTETVYELNEEEVNNVINITDNIADIITKIRDNKELNNIELLIVDHCLKMSIETLLEKHHLEDRKEKYSDVLKMIVVLINYIIL